jgi:hypothetical protein
MKNWIVFKRPYEGATHGVLSRPEWDAIRQFAASTVEFVAEADTQAEAEDMAEGYDAISRVGSICDL